MSFNFKAFSLFTILPALLFSQAKYSNEFLNIGVGARALGMSNAYVASTNDVTSGYWNPAGLLGIKSNMQLGVMHSEYFAGIAKYDYGAIGTKIDSNSALGFSMVRFGVDNIPNTTELIDANGNVNYDKISTFSAADYAFVISYARKLKIPGLKVGANAKIIRRVVGDFGGAWGFGLDAGAQYDYKKWVFAAMARDITTTFNAWSFNLTESMKNTFAQTGNVIPNNSVEVTLPKLIVGVSRKWYFLENKVSLLSEVDLDMSFDGKRNTVIRSNLTSMDPHGGIEAGYKDFIFLRAGLGNFQKSSDFTGTTVWTMQPNIGLGIRLGRIMLDYALTDIGDQSVALYSNVFSLRFDIHKKAATP